MMMRKFIICVLYGAVLLSFLSVSAAAEEPVKQSHGRPPLAPASR